MERWGGSGLVCSVLDNVNSQHFKIAMNRSLLPWKIKQIKTASNKGTGTPCHGTGEVNLTSIHEDVGLIPGLTQWVQFCHELWCRSKACLTFFLAVAVM